MDMVSPAQPSGRGSVCACPLPGRGEAFLFNGSYGGMDRSRQLSDGICQSGIPSCGKQYASVYGSLSSYADWAGAFSGGTAKQTEADAAY